jgi:arylsulfatase A-like enzyme
MASAWISFRGVSIVPVQEDRVPREVLPIPDRQPVGVTTYSATVRRQMENYAGFLEHTDHQVGRLIDSIDEPGLLDDTLIYYIIGDNGASAEGTIGGTFSAMISPNGGDDLQTTQVMLDHAFETLGLHRIALTVFEFNERAIRAYRRCGFVVEGRARESIWRDGRWWDELAMSVLASEWRVRHADLTGSSAASRKPADSSAEPIAG